MILTDLLFSTGDQYYRFNTKRYEVERGYPKPVYQFFTCAIVQTQQNDRLQNSIESQPQQQQQQQQRRRQYEEALKHSISSDSTSSGSSTTRKPYNIGLLTLPQLVVLMFNRCL